MAAAPFPPPPLNGSFSPFDIFKDGGPSRSTPPPPPPPAGPALPGGPCNFVDLTYGPNGPKCGCRRFWSRQVAGAAAHALDQTSWCMCSHHACFHDDAHNGNPQVTSAPVLDTVLEQENEKPRSNRLPLSPVQDFVSINMPGSLDAAAMDFTTMNFDSFSSNTGLLGNMPQANPPAPPLDTDSLPDTMSWKNVISTQGNHTTAPAVPSQCTRPHSQSASTTVSSQLRWARPFGGKGLNTLSSVPAIKDRHPRRDAAAINTGANNSSGLSKHSLLFENVVALPSEAPSRATTPTHRQSQEIKPKTRTGSVSPGSQNQETLQNLTSALDDHENRLDRLESGSIYNAGHDECSDKHDMTDLRLTELESRMDDAEKRLDDDASISAASCPHDFPSLAADREALAGQVEAMKSRINQLEASSLPSYTSPWQLEVVFLPFPLRGIWLEAQDFKTPRHSGGRDEWTPMPNTNTRATPDPQTLAAFDEWAGEHSGWLLPRACVPGRMIDKRLRSRGLVKTVKVRGGDARSVQIAVGNAFENMLRLIPSPASPRSPYAADARVDRFFGLQQSWVPLRKVHKDSRLRFLSPPEMLTPALWSPTFLMDSVVMKATGIHRLYITQPDAYLQDSHLMSHQDLEPGWTWQKLREFARVYPESQSTCDEAEVPEADALEDYWAYNARLDEPPRSRLPLAATLPQTPEKGVILSRASNGSTEQFFTVPSNPVASMNSPSVMRGQSPLIHRERAGSHPPPIRAGSVPPLHSPIMPSPARSSRRLSSYAIMPSLAGPSYHRQSSPFTTGRPSPRLSTASNNPPAAAMITKHRRRSTRSPSIRLRNTPSWTNRSYSRSRSATPAHLQTLHIIEQARGDRRVTPFAYATPYSNAPIEYPVARGHSRGISQNIPTYEEEDDDEEMDSDDDHGSSTDVDVDVYEDKDDMLDDLESKSEGRHHRTGQEHAPEHQPSSSPLQGPEDEPWPGIEDNEMSDSENVNPLNVDDNIDNRSDSSSRPPSEYPSTQRAWRLPEGAEGREMTHGLERDDADAGGIDFRIHEDDSEEEPEGQNLW